MCGELRQFKGEISQGLASSIPIAIVELLRQGEVSVGTLIEKLRIASQHLAVLRAKQIVVSRKVGNQVYYSIRDRARIEVVDILHRYAQTSTCFPGRAPSASLFITIRCIPLNICLSKKL